MRSLVLFSLAMSRYQHDGHKAVYLSPSVQEWQALDVMVELRETASLPCRAMLEVVERWNHDDVQDVEPRPYCSLVISMKWMGAA